MNRKFRHNTTWLLITQLIILSIFQTVYALQSYNSNTKPSSHQPKNNKIEHQKRYSRTEQDYILPDISLLSRHGEEVRLMDLLNNEQPVFLQFVFTTCSTICPVLSATFSSAQSSLKYIAPNYRMVSISIDPEQDTPHALNDYANRFKVGSQWHLLTGSRTKIAKIQHAFNAYYPGNNKMYHLPYTYLRAAGSKTWVRIHGLLSKQNLVDEYQDLTRNHTPSDITNDQ